MSEQNNDNTESKKPYVAMWDYQNDGEDFNRRIVLDVSPLMEADITEQAKKDIIAAMDDVVKYLTSTFNLMPKSSTQDNKVRTNSEVSSHDEK